MKRFAFWGFIIVVSVAFLQACAGARRAAGTAPDPPDLNTWLVSHPRIAKAIKWQHRPAGAGDPFLPPTEKDKTAWTAWTDSQKDELNRAFREACAWLARGAPQVPMDPAGLTDEPANLHPDKANSAAAAMEWVGAAYMWKLYIAHVAFSLAAEIMHQLPWSIDGYDDESLRYLFDSTAMAWNVDGTRYGMGTADAHVPAMRADNLPRTAFAPPFWTYPFLTEAGLVGASRLETICRVLDWMRHNLDHFYGNNSFGNYFAVWQHTGYPPLSKIVNGTIDINYPHLGFRHWTAGCHGSVGFLNAVLRVVNIPVQPVWICGHELPYFLPEQLYLDHGDNSYNGNVKNADVSIQSLLINEQTYQSWFTEDLAVNITDGRDPVCRNVGRRISEFRTEDVMH